MGTYVQLYERVCGGENGFASLVIQAESGAELINVAQLHDLNSTRRRTSEVSRGCRLVASSQRALAMMNN